MKWGILDTQDNLWMGDDDGPTLHDDQTKAQIAAQVIDMMLGNQPGRCRAKKFKRGPLRLRDEKPALRSPVEALERMEKGQLS